MIDKIKQIYGSALVIGPHAENEEKYVWYTSEDGIPFGIELERITGTEKQLLNSMFTPFVRSTLHRSEEEEYWFQFLYEGKGSPPGNIQHAEYRFIHFYIEEGIEEKQDFKEAIHGIFPVPVTIIFENKHFGAILDAADSGFEQLHLEDAINTFASDFFINVHFYMGQALAFSERIPDAFQWEQTCFKASLRYFEEQHVHSFQDVAPPLLLEKVDSDFRKRVADAVLHELENDKELLKTIRIFIECNLNVSLAAKKLYMHRNSLQYRIEKFIEKTGIDIKNFKGAAATYLAILIREQL